MATEQPPEFIIIKPVDFESTQHRPHASSTASVQKVRRWESIVENLLTKKLPRTERDWERILRTQDDVNRTLQRIVLPHLSPTEKAALSWRGRFDECSKHLKLLAQEKSEENPIELFRLAVIALSEVAIKEDIPSDEVYQYLRLCLRNYPKSGKQLGDESLRKTVKAVREGIRFVEGFTDVLGPRSNELPLYVKSWTTAFHDYTAECGEYIAQQKHRVYRPEKALQSGCLSVINVVYLLLGGGYSGRSPQKIRDIFLPNDTLDCQSCSGSIFPPRLPLQSCNPSSPAPRRGSDELFSFGGRAVELKQAAISDTLTDVIISRPISRPIQKAQGLYSFGLPLASKEYFYAAVLEDQSVKLKHWAAKKGITRETLLDLPAEAFRSEVGTASWPTSGGALLLPLTDKAVDVKLLDRATGTARRKVWRPNHIMYLEHEGLAAINGSIHYIYAPLQRPL